MFYKNSHKKFFNIVLLMILLTGQIAATPIKQDSINSQNPTLSTSFPAIENDLFKLPQQQEEIIQPEQIIKISGANGGDNPSISMDGRFIAYESNGEIILYDMGTNSNTIIASGTDPHISATGEYIVYVSGNNINIWMAIDDTHTFVAIGKQPQVSADGRYVAFVNSGCIFVRDHKNGTTSLISGTIPCTGVDYFPYPYSNFSFSGDGKFVAFNSSEGISVRNLKTQVTTIASLNQSGELPNDLTWKPAISLDGRYVGFLSYASNFGANPPDPLIMSGQNLFIRDTQTQTTKYVPIVVGGEQIGAVISPPSISADGKFVTFTLYDGRDYITDVEKGITTPIPVPVGYGGARNSQISADGKVIVFSAALNGTGETDIFVRGVFPKPPLILVHGFQGFSPTGGYHCTDDGDGSNDIEPYNGFNSTLFSQEPNVRNIADMFEEQGFEVWIAHLETNPETTWGIDKNGECLRDQIEYVATLNSLPITVVAHSYGGLVSRSAIRGISDNVEINALYTLGSPHAGIPSEIIISFLYSQQLWLIPFTDVIGIDIRNICKNERQIGVCNMTPTYMPTFNKKNLNVRNIHYTFIGGDGGDGILTGMWGLFAEGTTYAPNDGLAGTYSGVGWVHPEKEFSSNWTIQSPLNQFITDETHPAFSDPLKSFYVAQSENGPVAEGYSDSFLCIQSVMNNEIPNSNHHCEPAQNYQPPTSIQPPTSQSENTVAIVEANQTESTQSSVDNNSEVLFYIQWSGTSAPIFTLTTPNSETIDFAYAVLHPEEVSYETGDGGDISLPYIAYRVVNAPVGTWELNITATDDVAYQSIVVIADSTRILEVSTNLDIYQGGDIATITAELESNGVGLAGATVTVDLMRPDEVIDTITLLDPENDGVYVGTYTIPDAPGFMPVEVHASGIDNGVAYTRQKSLILSIAPNDLQLTGNNSDSLNDDNSNGFAESLDFTFEINADIAEEYNISAELYAGNELITHAADYFTLNTGTQTVTLQFNGSDIRETGLSGPYTIKNLSATPLSIGIQDLYVENVHSTSSYSYTDFGRYACYLLTVNHTGNGSDPEFDPSNSDGCFTNEFTAGEFINLTATPSAGWSVGNWDGTIADASGANTNIALMPANSHTVSVNYTTPDAPWNTFLGGSAVDRVRNASMTRDENGNIYIAGASNSDWGNPIRNYQGDQDVFVVKLDSSGELIWSTFLGGSGFERIGGLVTNANGDLYVVGESTASWGNPIRSYVGNTDSFIAKLDSSGNLLWNSFLGGEELDQAGGIALDSNENIYISGNSNAGWETPLETYNASDDIYLVKLDPSGNLIWNTFIGDTKSELTFEVIVDENNNIYIAGISRIVDPIALDWDAHVFKFNASGALLWNTIMGAGGDDIAYDMAISGNNLYVSGRTTATWGDPIMTYNTGQDSFVAKLDPSDGNYIWHTFYGGAGTDFGYDIEVDNAGNLNIAGSSSAGWGNPIRAYESGYDAVFVKLNPNGGLLANAFLGGTGEDKGYGLVLNDNGAIYLAGYGSATWETPILPYTASDDVFVSRFSIDSTPLIVSSVTRTSVNPTSATNVDYTIVFSEAVTGVDVSDFTLTTTGVIGASITGVSGSGDTYTVTVNTGSGEGTLRLDVVDDDTILNSTSNPLVGGFVTGQNYLVDKLVPTVLSSIRSPANPNFSGINFTVTFSESVTGVDVSDFGLTTTGVTGASISSISGSGNVYIVNVNSGTGSGTVKLNIIDNDTILDAASKPLGGVGNGSYTTGQSFTLTSVTLNSLATQDGHILESTENSGVGGTVNSTGISFVVGDDATDKQYISVMHFNTSTLPDTVSISSATVKVKQQGTVTGTNPFTTHGTLVLDIQNPYFGTSNSLVVADFQAVAGQSDVATFDSTPVSSWYNAFINSTGYVQINLISTTQIRIRFSMDDNDDNGADYIAFSSGNNTTVANRPQLIIQYYTP